MCDVEDLAETMEEITYHQSDDIDFLHINVSAESSVKSVSIYQPWERLKKNKKHVDIGAILVNASDDSIVCMIPPALDRAVHHEINIREGDYVLIPFSSGVFDRNIVGEAEPDNNNINGSTDNVNGVAKSVSADLSHQSKQSKNSNDESEENRGKKSETKTENSFENKQRFFNVILRHSNEGNVTCKVIENDPLRLWNCFNLAIKYLIKDLDVKTTFNSSDNSYKLITTKVGIMHLAVLELSESLIGQNCSFIIDCTKCFNLSPV